MTDAQDDEVKSPIDPAHDVEINIVRDMARRSIFLIVPVALIASMLGDYKDGLAVAFAGLIIIGNMYLAAQITRFSARISTEAIMGGVLASFVVRLAIIFVIALAVRSMEIFDYKVWILSVAIGHIALLAWETKYINFSLGEPGVRPKKK